MGFWLMSGMGALLGAIVGSFLATIVIRWPLGESIVHGRSRCDACAAPIPASRLVPLLSFALQGGRCHSCRAMIPRLHPAMELASAIIGAVSIGLNADHLVQGIALAVFGWTMLVLAILDCRYLWLPDRLTLGLVAAGLAAGLLGIGPGLQASLVGALSGFASLAAVAWLFRWIRKVEGLGGGDPKMFAAIGAWLGWELLPAVLAGASLLGLAAAVVMALNGRVISKQTALPFGTFLALASWPVAVFANTNW